MWSLEAVSSVNTDFVMLGVVVSSSFYAGIVEAAAKPQPPRGVSKLTCPQLVENQVT